MVPSMLTILLLNPLSGCTSATEGDSGEEVDNEDTEDTEEPFECPTPEIHVNGEDPPVVGAYWEVFLWCDNTLMTGAMHMGIDPPSMATIEDYHMVYNEAGTGVLSVQVGTIKAEREVIVGAATE